MEKELRILIVEDAPDDAELEVLELKRAGLRVAHQRVDTEEAFREALREFRPELILSDFSMPRFDGMSALALAREINPDVPFIFVSGTIGEEYAIRALKNGATDYVLKNNLIRLPAAVERALQDAEERALRRKMERELHESHERFQALLEVAPDAIVLVDSRGAIVLANAEMERVFGYKREELLGNSVDRLVPEVHRSAHAGHRSDYLANPRTRRMAALASLQGQRKDGSLIPVEISLSPVVFNNETHVVGIVRDVTERREQELKIARLSRIHSVLSGINSTIVRVHEASKLFEEACRIAVEYGKFRFAWIGTLDMDTQKVTPAATSGHDDGYLSQINLTVEEDIPGNCELTARALTQAVPVVCNDIASDDRMKVWRAEALKRGYRSVALLPLILDSRAVGVFVLYAPEPSAFDEEEMKLLVEMADDVSFAMKHIENEERLNYLAYFDEITGLPNRALFSDRFDQRLSAARHDQQICSMIMLDLERFRTINETLGRQAGDELLRLLAQRLKEGLEETDILARLSGDCFVIATRRTATGSDTSIILDQILLRIQAQPFSVGGTELRIAAKAGVAVFPGDGEDVETLYHNAEAALRDAKASGQRYLFYARQMNARVAEKLTIENKLRKAVEREEFVLHYQPKISLVTKRITGVEALIRWADPEAGLVAPGLFIPVLEETGLILEVGKWVMKQALVDLDRWCAAGAEPVRIAVNVSAIQLRQKSFVGDVQKVVAARKDLAASLEIEITESLVMENIEQNIPKLAAIRELGATVAVDDFGTGYSSLSYIAKLPISALKIDQSFVKSMTDSADSMSIVQTIISLAHSLKLNVIAEGVETAEQEKLLGLLRCDEAQGFLFSRPISADHTLELLQKQSKGIRGR